MGKFNFYSCEERAKIDSRHHILQDKSKIFADVVLIWAVNNKAESTVILACDLATGSISNYLVTGQVYEDVDMSSYVNSTNEDIALVAWITEGRDQVEIMEFNTKSIQDGKPIAFSTVESILSGPGQYFGTICAT